MFCLISEKKILGSIRSFLFLALLGSPVLVHAITITPYFPLQSGASWDYTIGYSTEILANPVTVNGVSTSQMRDSDGNSLYFTNDEQGIRLHRIDTPSIGTIVTFSPPLLTSAKETFLGNQAVSSGNVSFSISGVGVFSLSYTSTATLDVTQEVIVPAGTFSTLRLNWTYRIFGTVRGQSLSEMQTEFVSLARDVGVVRDEELGFGAVDLVSFDVGVPLGMAVKNDLNGDGKSDVLLRNNNGGWYYYPMNGKNIVSGSQGFSPLTNSLAWTYQGTGDFNGDGKKDVLMRNTNGRWFYYPMDGKNFITGVHGPINLTSNNAWRFAGIGDLNADGNDDIVMRHSVTGRWYYYPMSGRNVISAQQGFMNLTSNRAWEYKGIGDLNGDGRDDIVLRHTGTNRWYYYPMIGKNTILSGQGFSGMTSSADWQFSGIGDFNGDGNDDVLVRNTVNNAWFYYPMNGKNIILSQQGFMNLARSSAWRLAQIGDQNGDGMDDVLVRNTSGSWYYYPMNGKSVIPGQHGFAKLTTSPVWSIRTN